MTLLPLETALPITLTSWTVLIVSILITAAWLISLYR